MTRTRRGLAIAVTLFGLATTAIGQPVDPSAGSSADPGAGTDLDPDPAAAGSTDDPAAGSSIDPAAGSSADPAASSGSASNPAVSSGSATGSGAGSGSASDPVAPGSAGSATGSAAGSGSAGPTIIQLPTDIAAPQVSAAATPTVVRLGAPFTVVIRATYGDGVEVNLREPVELGSVFEVRRKLSEDRKVSGGRTTREWQLEVVAWELGALVMPPISVTYTAFGRAGQVQTNRVRLEITGVLGEVIDDPKLMRGMAPPTDLIARDWFWLWVAGAALAVLALSITLWSWRRRRRRRVVSLVAGSVARPRRIDMTSERALEKLLAIEASGVLARDADRRGGYAEMVEVIRDYLGARYRIQTFELTSSELLRGLERVAPAQECELVEEWLGQCDIVKYGGLRTTTAEAKKTLDDARALIVTTTNLQQAAAAREAA